MPSNQAMPSNQWCDDVVEFANRFAKPHETLAGSSSGSGARAQTTHETVGIGNSSSPIHEVGHSHALCSFAVPVGEDQDGAWA